MRDLDEDAHQKTALALLKGEGDDSSMEKAKSSAKHDGKL